MSNPRKRKALSISDKVSILREIEKGMTNVLVCQKFNLSPSTVSTIVKNEENIFKAFYENNANAKKMRMTEKKYWWNAFWMVFNKYPN